MAIGNECISQPIGTRSIPGVDGNWFGKTKGESIVHVVIIVV